MKNLSRGADFLKMIFAAILLVPRDKANAEKSMINVKYKKNENVFSGCY